MKEKISQYRLSLMLIIILIPSFVAVSLINYYVQRDSIRDELITTSLPLVRDLIDWEVQSRIKEPILTASLMANDTFLIDWILYVEVDLSKIENYLNAIRLEHNYASSFFVSANTFRYYSYQGVHKEISIMDDHDVWYFDFLDSGKKMALDVDTDEVSAGKLTVFINQRVTDAQGNFLGVVGVGVDMSSIAELLQKTQKLYGRTIYMIDDNGLIQAHSNVEIIEKHNIRTSDGISNIADSILAAKKGTADFSYYGKQGKVLLTSRYISIMNWYIIVEQDESISLMMIRRTLIRTILIGLAASFIAVFISIGIVYKYQKSLEISARIDHLTQVSNRMQLDYQLRSEYERVLRYGGEFSVLLMDIDNFKEINDTLGHQLGDAILKAFASFITESVRKTDYFGRWGGDEFVLILPSTSGEKAMVVAEQLRLRLAERELEQLCPVRMSIGIAEYQAEDTVESILMRADNALYKAKQSGKDKSAFS